MRVFTTKRQKIGEFGERVTRETLENDGFVLIQQNYSCRLGEIDLIFVPRETSKDHIIFVEVKTILGDFNKKNLRFPPELQFHVKKQHSFIATVYDFIEKNNVSRETSWEIWLACVFLNIERGRYKIRIWKQPFL